MATEVASEHPTDGGAGRAHGRRQLRSTDGANRPPLAAGAAELSAPLPKASPVATKENAYHVLSKKDKALQACTPSLVPTVHSLAPTSDGALLLDVQQGSPPLAWSRAQVLCAPVRTVVIRHLEGAAAAAADAGPPGTPTRASVAPLRVAIHALVLPGPDGDMALPLPALETAAHTTFNGTPMPTSSDCALLAVRSSLPACPYKLPACPADCLLLRIGKTSTNRVSWLADCLQALFNDEEGYGSVPALGAATATASDMSPTSPPASTTPLATMSPPLEADTDLVAHNEPTCPAPGDALRGERAAAAAQPTCMQPMVDEQEGASDPTTSVQEAAAYLPRAPIMVTTTKWSRSLWADGYTSGLQAENARLTLAGRLPSGFDPNCPLLSVLMFRTPAMPAAVVGGAARWMELVLPHPRLSMVALDSGVLRVGLWAAAATPMGQATVYPAPLPLNFAGASQELTALLLACIWHEANRAEGYVISSYFAAGSVSVEGSMWSLAELADWLLAAGCPMPLDCVAEVAAATV